ncbi:hypothetical protein J7K50_05790 [bacterium]|nr:hypothetical protein [bacterium]
MLLSQAVLAENDHTDADAIIASVCEKCSGWLPERLLQLEYICEYDASLYSDNGDVIASFPARHPYTRGIALDLMAEWLLYGGYEPSDVIEAESSYILLYITKKNTPTFTYLPTALSRIHGRLVGPLDFFSLSSRESSPSGFDEYGVDAWWINTAIRIDKATELPDTIDMFMEQVSDYGMVRYRFTYDDSGNLNAINLLNTKENLASYDPIDPPGDDELTLLLEYRFAYDNGIGYIHEVAKQGKTVVVKIENFSVTPWENKLGEHKFLRKLHELAYSPREPGY